MFDNLPTNNNSTQDQNPAPPYPNTNNNDSRYNPPLPNTVSQNMPRSQSEMNPAAVPGQNQAQSTGYNHGLASGKPIEDIFSEPGSREKPAVFRPKDPSILSNQYNGMDPMSMDPYAGQTVNTKNRTIVFASMLISFMLVCLLGWFAYSQFFSNVAPAVNNIPAPEPELETKTTPEPVNTQNPEPIKNTNTNDSLNNTATTVTDSDNDGLSDEEERALGTDILLSDTDGDGLFDREEVKVYKTNPLDRDTDRDTFSDGQEVKGGYNPNGTGTMYNLNNKQ